MKTLIYTSIYSNLWGTDFGGRPSRKLHYSYSLLSILEMNADKYICFTSEEEIEELRDWFYVHNSVSSEKLEFIEFDLHKSQYFEDIKKLKNVEFMKTTDRCYEIQYNKFFWLDMLPNLESFDRVFWVDSGLSHGGIFHEKYSYGSGIEKDYKFSLFNNSFLKKIINLTDDKLLILSKNNTGRFYWSTTIPRHYYTQYDNSEHIIGGLFGGKVQNMLVFRLKFASLLNDLLKNENSLFFEELIMSCVYQNNKSSFITLKFDDWYERPGIPVTESNITYFYNMFEINKVCVCTSSIEISNGSHYVEKTKILIETYLTHTNFDILVLTNRIDEFNELNNNNRVKLIDYSSNFSEPIISQGKFNMHIKRYTIKLSKNLGYEIIYFHDCDCYIVGWDTKSFEDKCNEDFDVAFVSHAHPQLGSLRKTYKHFQDKIDNEFGDLYFDKLDESPNPAETRVIFKNNEKLDNFLHFWDLISERNKDYFTYHDGVYFGTSAVYANMKMIGVNNNDKFSSFCRISHAGRVLDYFGTTLIEDEYVLKHTISDLPEPTFILQESNTDLIEPKEHINTNDLIIRGNFTYKEILVQQNPKIIEVFEEVLNEVHPDLIIEIGTGYGGMTLILNDILTKLNLYSTNIKSFDVIPLNNLPSNYLSENVELIINDIFEPSYDDLNDQFKDIIHNLIQSHKTTLILCDGSKNIKEFNVLSKYIKSGDIIMIHDYAKDQETFDNFIKEKVWNWFEVSEKDLEESSRKYGLEPFMESKLDSVAWGSKIKK